MTVHDLDRHRDRRSRRRWLPIAIAIGAASLVLFCLVGLCVILPGPSSAPARSSARGAAFAFPPRGACLAHVAHRGPAPCPFAARAEGSSDWATAFELGHECLDAGALFLPTGEVVATDPLVAPDQPALALRFPAGTRAEVWIARRDGDNTLAMLLVGSERPVRFEEARTVGGGGGAYGVDSGTGSFLDVTAARTLTAHVPAEPGIWDAMIASGWETASHVNVCLDDVAGTNVVVFTSGAGDGVYGTHAGYDARGTLVALITDFDLDPLGEEE